MIMNTFLICIIVCSLYGLVIYKILSSKIKKKIDNKTFLKEVHDEINSLVAQINETSDRNVLLIENRLERLSNLISISDITLSELKRFNSDSRENISENKKNTTNKINNSETGNIQNSINIIKNERIEKVVDEGKFHVLNDNETLTKRERILLLHKQGISPSVIASQTKATIGEVELIISLNRG